MRKVKKRRKFNPKKLIKTWAIIIGIIGIIMIFTPNQRKENEQEVSSTNIVENNTITVTVDKPEINIKLKEWNLILVNKDNKIPQDYQYELTTVENVHKVDTRMVEALNHMMTDARKEGLKPLICSGYRSLETQTTLFNQKVNEYKIQGWNDEEAEEKASYWVTNPKTSEHEIGISVDIVSVDYQVLDEEQETTDVQRWLIEHCTDYGFVLRYPTSKKHITKINYEPWHYRYVGVENAKFMKEKDFCLEEYIEYLKKM